MDDTGSRIAEQGWQQGAIVRDEDWRRFARESGYDHQPSQMAVVITQSCDLVHDPLEGEPCVELIVGRRIPEKASGMLTHGKNPRGLHVPVQLREAGPVTCHFLPWDRILLPREQLLDCVPDSPYLLRDDLRVLLVWLAQRYIRAGLPDDFNQLLKSQRKKWDRIQKRMSPHVSGLYIQLDPSRNLEAGEQYRVNLLALVPDQESGALRQVQQDAGGMADLLQEAGMEVESSARLESKIPYGTVARMIRFPLEYLSLRGDPADPMPADLRPW